MSRIEEALRRARPEAIADGPVYERSSTSPEYALAQYPQEGAAVARAPEPSLPKSGVIAAPRMRRGGQFSSFDPAVEGKLIVGSMSRRSVEEYSRLAAAFHEAQIERNVKIVMVSSAIPGEGKSLTITNLALTLSESYKRRVLLIDADLRLPSIHEIFRLPNTAGLSDGLRSERASLSLVEISPRLTVLPAGHADGNPMADLTSKRMKKILDEAAAEFDWVLVDTPPAGLLPDATLLARLTDAVLLVIAAGRTPYALVQRTISAFGPEQLIGTVLNRAEPSGAEPHAYYDRYYGRAGTSEQ
jgi:protein-tyrosine kinase